MLITYVIIRDKFLVIPFWTIYMKISPALLFFDPDVLRLPNGKPHRLAVSLQAAGFAVQSCTAATSLHTSALSAQDERQAPLLVVLGGSHAENCAAAMYLRTVCPRAGLVALVHAYREPQLIQAMQCGIDAFCPRAASPGFIMALLCQLMLRMGHLNFVRPTEQTQASQGYRLLEQAWVLSGPQGRRVALTAGERAFLTALLGAAGQRATHGQLGVAVSAAYGGKAPAVSPVRLALLISRLRRKCMGRGLALPIKSVHSWGYMFAASI